MLIPTTALQIDELVDNLIAEGENLSAYFSDIDSEIHAICIENGVAIADIPVDEDGYVTSIHLKKMAQYYGAWAILKGYNGVGGYPQDVYESKLQMYYEQYSRWKDRITSDVILGGTGIDPLPSKSAYVRQIGLFF
jgi:hypothetical protein